MTRPVTAPATWATEINYTSGVDAGTPTKSAPTAGQRAQGFIPDVGAPAQHFNHLLNADGQWLDYLKNLDFLNFLPIDPVAFSASTIDQGAMGSLGFRPDVTGGQLGSRFVGAFQASSHLFRSLDGISWLTIGSVGTFTGVFHPRSLHWSALASIWILGTKTGSTDDILTATGDPPVTWTARTDPSAATDHGGIAENGSIIVMPTGGGPGSGIITSTNGTAWTIRTDPTGGTKHAAAWSPELALFVIVGQSGAIVTSPDGITWTDRSIAVANFNDVCWDKANLRFVAVGVGRIVYTSADGITWTNRSFSGTFSGDCRSIAVDGSGTLYLTTDEYVFLSNDGAVTWIAQRRPGNLAAIPFVLFFDNRPILIGTSSKNAGTIFGFSLGLRGRQTFGPAAP